ncbi:MAG: stage V sporulation protein AD [Oscillospiraceae bacterium]|jgi:stage V sporulation protein AD|nr:stage V sporulation protein AD [Oscillospiraceae bacterium]MDE6996759.1 stage V sporulation protein AD [Oscillospiraceae bacterium]
MQKRLGRQTVALEKPAVILSHAAVGGKQEGEGPLAEYFDHLCEDSFFGETTWEKAESAMQKLALSRALEKGGFSPGQMDYVLAGDLLNQCIGTSFGLRDFNIPFYGLYGACSTMGESMALGSLLIAGGFAQRLAAMTSSHFCTAERQYRMPVPYGNQRTPTAQWTATASGCMILGDEGNGPRITTVTCGKIVDKGICDVNNMGAAMAPAAYDTLAAHFQATGTSPSDYDLVVTGDLGVLGHQIVTDFFAQDGIDMSRNYQDCGMLLYDIQKQDMHAGASGCGCSASVLCGYFLRQMAEGHLHKLLFAPTGALLSPTSSFQGESIPSICHAVTIEK